MWRSVRLILTFVRFKRDCEVHMRGGVVRRFRNGLAGLVIAVGCSVLGAAPAPGGLSISTDPDNASVYVDGRPVGVSPLQLPSVAAGDHRIRIVKSGYLENARIVTVSAGAAKTIQVRLTRTADPANAGQVVTPAGGGGGGGSKKWLYIAAAGGGAAAAAVLATSNKNHAPTAGTATMSPTGTGIAAVTGFSFASSGATDPDGDGLTLTWNFGDGATSTGANVTHTFQSAGTFNVSLTVSDGKAEVKAADLPVTIRNVNGTWVSNVSGTIRTWTLTQSGTNVSGSYSNSASPGTSGTVSGSLAGPRTFSGTAGLVGFQSFLVTGTFDSAVAVLTVIANGSGFDNDTLTFTRQ
jgi:hypothetical protein